MADKSIALQKPTDTPSPAHGEANQATVYKILIAISFVHLFNDSIQSVIPAIFPILKDNLPLPLRRSVGSPLPLILLHPLFSRLSGMPRIEDRHQFCFRSVCVSPSQAYSFSRMHIHISLFCSRSF